MFELTDRQSALIEEAARFSSSYAGPVEAAGADSSLRIFRDFCEHGYQALLVPERYGGKGLDYTTAGLIYEELGYGYLPVMPSILTTTHCVEFVKIAGAEAVKHSLFAMTANDRIPLGFGLTEEMAGSDIAAIQCRAERRNGGFTLSGRKTVVLNSLIAGAYVIIATTAPGTGRAGLNAFIVDADAPGVVRKAPYNGLGFKNTVVGEIELNEVSLAEGAMLGDEGSGYFTLMETFDKCRPFVAACCVGAARRVFDTIVEHSKAREQMGKPLFSFQGISFRLADFAARLRASRLLYLEALSLVDRGLAFTMEASIAKLYASETLRDLAEFGLEVLGYRGIYRDNPVRDIFMDAQLLISIDGSSNVQRMIIASQL